MHRDPRRPSIARALAALAALAACSDDPPPPEGQPNFVLCMADDLGWSDVGYRGSSPVRTPALDAMAAAGLALERFYAAAPSCSPTRASVLTGRHPNRARCFNWGHPLVPEERTLAEVLSERGYATGHFGKWHLGSIRAGDPDCPGAAGFSEWLSSANVFESDPGFSANGEPKKLAGEGSLAVVEAALDFARSAADRGRPFLAVVWFSSPHLPYRAAPEDLADYADAPPELAGYYAEIAALDRALGHLRGELARARLSERTLVWFTSDNGALHPGELAGTKNTLGEGGIRVPCVLEWPGRIAPGTSAAPCGTVDVFPTLLELAGIDVGHGPPLDGASLAPLLAGRPFERPAPLGFWTLPVEGIPVQSELELRALLRGAPRPGAARAAGDPPEREGPEPVEAVAWIDGRYKLVGEPGSGALRLHDLEADPRETRDLAASEPERAARMRAELEAWRASVRRSMDGADYAP
jgi:arylsulfatase A-like enzyme